VINVVAAAPSAISLVTTNPNFQIETPNAPMSSVINDPLERKARRTIMEMRNTDDCRRCVMPESKVQYARSAPIATKRSAADMKSGWREVGKIPKSGRTGI
jgi:hypothetical protein